MKAQVRKPLANLLDVGPGWPNPEESIGDFIKAIDGKKSCWKAKGPARDTFEILAGDIKTYLDKCVESIPGSDWVTWSIYMIGKTPQRAAPVIMFFCEEPRPRRKVQEVIKKCKILERYPGVKSGNAALPPDFDQLEPLASDAVSNNDMAETEGSRLDITISASRNKIFVRGHHGNTFPPRIATLGGIVQHNGDAYVFTAGHPFDKTSPSGPPREPKVIDEEWEIDSDSDGDAEVDIYDEGFTETMSRASASSCSDDGSSDTHSTRSPQFSDASTPVEDRVFDQPSQMQAARCRAVETWASEDTIPTMNIHKLGQNASAAAASAATEGQLVVHSADLDYALIKFKDPSLVTVKDCAGNRSAANSLQPTHVIQMGPSDTEIISYTASGGLMTGTLYGTPSYTRLPNSKTFQEVYTVRFNRPLTKGDCGSWVIDVETCGLYGHIIAGCERTGTAYIMSADKVFKDAQRRLGSEIMLPGGILLKEKDTVDKSARMRLSRCLISKMKGKQTEPDAQPQKRIPPMLPPDFPHSQSDLTDRNMSWSSLKQKDQLRSATMFTGKYDLSKLDVEDEKIEDGAPQRCKSIRRVSFKATKGTKRHYEYYRFTRSDDWTVADRIKIPVPHEELEKTVSKAKKNSSVLETLKKMSPDRRAQINRLLDLKNLGEESKDAQWHCVFVDSPTSKVGEFVNKRVQQHKVMNVIVAQHILPGRAKSTSREMSKSFVEERSDINKPLIMEDKAKDKDGHTEIPYDIDNLILPSTATECNIEPLPNIQSWISQPIFAQQPDSYNNALPPNDVYSSFDTNLFTSGCGVIPPTPRATEGPSLLNTLTYQPQQEYLTTNSSCAISYSRHESNRTSISSFLSRSCSPTQLRSTASAPTFSHSSSISEYNKTVNTTPRYKQHAIPTSSQPERQSQSSNNSLHAYGIPIPITSPNDVLKDAKMAFGVAPSDTVKAIQFGTLRVPEPNQPQADLICPLQILDCEESFNDIRLWKTHIFTHFRGHPCPETATCFLCERVFDQSPIDHPARAWNEMLSHMATEHFRGMGQRLATVRTDFRLMRWMYNRRIITPAQFRRTQLLSRPTVLAESTGEVVSMPEAPMAPSPVSSSSPPVEQSDVYTVQASPRRERTPRLRTRP